jgi:GxxExxY protein
VKRKGARGPRIGLEEPDEEINRPGATLLDAAVEVLDLGPGFLESAYEHALCEELTRGGVQHRRQGAVVVDYRGKCVGLPRALAIK